MAMGSLHPREERKALSLSARMLAEEGWRDVTLCNVSSRGMRLKSACAPNRNTFIEIRYRTQSIVGRVIWSRGEDFGIQTQDTIDIAKLVSQISGAYRKGSADRRLREPTAVLPSLAIRELPIEDASRIFARLFEWSATALVVAAGAAILAGSALDVMGEPLARAQIVLKKQSARTTGK